MDTSSLSAEYVSCIGRLNPPDLLYYDEDSKKKKEYNLLAQSVNLLLSRGIL